jgi:hypothetical protein
MGRDCSVAKLRLRNLVSKQRAEVKSNFKPRPKRLELDGVARPGHFAKHKR